MIIGFDGNFDRLNPPAPIQSGSGSLEWVLGFAHKEETPPKSKKNGARMVVKNGHFLKLIRNEDIYETKPNKQHPNS